MSRDVAGRRKRGRMRSTSSLLITLVLFVVVLFLLALDWGIARDAYVHLRDLTLVTLILLGYGRGVYLMAHH